MKYLQLRTLHSELKELLIEYDMKKQEVHPSSTTSQASAARGGRGSGGVGDELERKGDRKTMGDGKNPAKWNFPGGRRSDGTMSQRGRKRQEQLGDGK